MEDEPSALESAAGEFSKQRGRPCLVMVSHVCRPLADLIDQATCSLDGDALDLVVHSPGGDLHAAYLIVRTLRRRFKQTTAFVPSWAKSAATLIALGMSELVLCEYGELGPLDAQLEQGKPGDFRRPKSCLERFKGLEQTQTHSVETFNMLVQICLAQKLQISDACKVATDFTAAVAGPMYAKVDPDALGESARFLAVGEEYAHRVLRRYRREIYDRSLVRRLVWTYPDHGFVIDREELLEMGIPAVTPHENVVDSLEAMRVELQELDEDDHNVFLAGRPRAESVEAAKTPVDGEEFAQGPSGDDAAKDKPGKASIHKVKG